MIDDSLTVSCGGAIGGGRRQETEARAVPEGTTGSITIRNGVGSKVGQNLGPGDPLGKPEACHPW